MYEVMEENQEPTPIPTQPEPMTNTEELDKDINSIQKSTKTTFPVFTRIHHNLRNKFGWYYNWHISGVANYIHIIILAVYVFIFLLVIFNIFF